MWTKPAWCTAHRRFSRIEAGLRPRGGFKPIGPRKRTEIIEPHAHLSHDLMRHLGRHLADVERFLDHKMVNPVGAAEVEAERLQWPHPPGVEYLGLLDHIAQLNIAVVVHVGTDEVQAKGAQHVGADDHHGRDIDHVHHLQGTDGPGDRRAQQAGDAVGGMKTEEHVPHAPMQQRQRRVHQQRTLEDLEFVVPGLGAQHADKRRHHVIAHHQQPRQAPGLAVGDGAFFHIGLGAGDFVMIEVQVPANPRVDGARPRQPDQAHHQVVRQALLAKIHAVDQVVFQLVGQ